MANNIKLVRNYNLNIAGYNIRFDSGEDGPDLEPSIKFLRNICDDTRPDILIRVHSGNFTLPEDADRVFHAPFVEEINGIPVHHKANFWSIWKSEKELFIKSVFPLCPDDRKAVMQFALEKKEWDLWIDCADKAVDPLEYPLDGLILYYLTVINGDIMIHASGVKYNGKGFLFSGVSGKGKTTIARLWESSGAKVIHDDRLIIRNTDSGYTIYNTPVYNNDVPDESPLSKLYIIDHGTSDSIVPIKGAVAASLVMSNCIQHNWGHEIITKLLGSVSSMCETVSVFKLHFVPEKSVVNFILQNG